MPHRSTATRRTSLTLALTAALSALAQPGLAAVDTEIDTTISLRQTWSEGNFTVTETGAIITDTGSGPAVFSSGTLGNFINRGIIDNQTIDGGPSLQNHGTIATLLNVGTLGSGVRNVSSTNTASIGELINEGLITSLSGSSAVDNVSGSIGKLTNTGQISGEIGLRNFRSATTTTLINHGTIAGITEGIRNDRSTIGTLNNSGTITGGEYGLYQDMGEITTLDNSGTITGGIAAIWNQGTIGALRNSGTITSEPASGGGSNQPPIGAIHNAMQGDIGTISNTGNITSELFGISNFGTIGTLNNAGTLTSGVAVYNSGDLSEIINTGTIRGLGQGLFPELPATALMLVRTLPQSPATTIHNSGEIVAPVAILAAYQDIANSGVAPDRTIGVLNNSGTVAGLVFAGITDSTGPLPDASSYSYFINGGRDTFGTITGVSGDVGLIQSYGPTVTFGTGKLLLNSHIESGIPDVIPSDPSAPPTPPLPLFVTNTAATLQVNQPIRIDGSYNQAASATLQIGVGDNAVTTGSAANDSGYGRLVVQGAAVIDAGSAVTLQKTGNHVFAPGQRYVAIDAGATGTQYNESTLRYSVNDVTSDVSGATVTDADRSRLVLTINGVQENAPPANPATTPNARAALDGLARYTGVDDAKLLDLFNAGQALRIGGADMANRAGNQLAPVYSSSLASIAQSMTLTVSDRLLQRTAPPTLIAQTNSGIATGDTRPALGAWGQVYGGHANQNRRDDVEGYGADFGGLMLGLDRAVGDRWRLGGVLSYGNAKTDFKGSISGNDAKIDSYGLAVYAGYTAGRWYANLSAGAYEQRYRTTRNISFTGFSGQARGKFDGQQYVLRAEAGYLLSLGAATLTPLAALNYSGTRQDGYTESGGNGAALSVRSSSTTSITSDLGARLARNVESSWGALSPELQLAWRHQYRNRKTLNTAGFAADPTGQTAFTTVGAAPVRDSALVSAGLTLHSSDTLSLSARYDLQAGGGFTSHAGGLRLRKQF